MGLAQTDNETGSVRYVCCICDEPVSPPYNLIRQRIYCDRHFANVNKPHQGFWRSALVQILGMGVFSVAVVLISDYIGPLDDTWRVPAGLGLVLAPSALWLYYFYRQDRLEPEPKTRILAVFLLALFLTEAVGNKVVTEWYRVQEWAPYLSVTSLLASILIAGFIWQAIIYVSIRLVVYTTPEFDERMDGLVYGTVAGLGVATLVNLRYVLDNGGVALGPGVIQIVTTALAQASFGGVLGYFMAQAKFEHRPAWWVPMGLAVAAILNGLFSWLINEVSADGLGVAPWRSLAFGLIVALVAFAVLLMLMQQATRSTPPRRAS